jgi:hypothetical protein
VAAEGPAVLEWGIDEIAVFGNRLLLARHRLPAREFGEDVTGSRDK